jgi:hypothetical protein
MPPVHPVRQGEIAVAELMAIGIRHTASGPALRTGSEPLLASTRRRE